MGYSVHRLCQRMVYNVKWSLQLDFGYNGIVEPLSDVAKYSQFSSPEPNANYDIRVTPWVISGLNEPLFEIKKDK